jgi:hypothetical protein
MDEKFFKIIEKTKLLFYIIQAIFWIIVIHLANVNYAFVLTDCNIVNCFS